MDWDPEKLDRAEKVLNQGRPSGPRLDAVWERLRPTVEVARVPAWRKALAAWWAWGPVLATAGVLLVMAPDAFRARGVDGDTVLVLASCGGKDTPCRVGQPVFLQLEAHPQGGEVSLLLQSSTGAAWLGDAVIPSTTARVPVEVKVVPDARDATTGLTVRAFWSATPLSSARRDAILSGAESPLPQHVLTLEVLP
jgi:hypothetical protein